MVKLNQLKDIIKKCITRDNPIPPASMKKEFKTEEYSKEELESFRNDLIESYKTIILDTTATPDEKKTAMISVLQGMELCCESSSKDENICMKKQICTECPYGPYMDEIVKFLNELKAQAQGGQQV